MAKKTPFDDDPAESATVALADKKAQEQLERRVQDKEQEPAKGLRVPNAPIDIDLEEAEESLDPAMQPAAANKSRWEKRQERYREMQSRADEAQRRAEAAERRETETRQMVSQLQSQLQSHLTQKPKAEPEADPLDGQLDQLFREQDFLYRDYNARAGQLTPAEHEEFAKKQRQLSRRMLEIGGEIAVKKMGLQKADPQATRAQVVQQELDMRHGDVLRDERMRLYADGVWRQLRAKGREDDWGTIDEAMETTRKAFGLRSKHAAPAPSSSYKQRLQGSPRGTGGSGQEPRQVITMTKEMQIMADAAYSHIKDRSQRYKLWAAGPGKRLMAKLQSAS